MISILVPVYNEEKSLNELYSRVVDSLGKNDFEIIFINDGSSDGSGKIIETLARKDKRVKQINFKRNKGKSAVLTEGFEQAKGELIVTLDADLQDHPEEIKELIRKLNDGYDLVSGWKKQRNDPTVFVLFSRLFNWVIRKTTGIKLHDINCGLKIYRKEVVKNLHLYGDLYRFIPVLAAKEGFRVGEIEVDHSPRKYGHSKYGFSKFFKGFFDLMTVLFLTNFQVKPFHFFGTVGISLFSAGLIICFYLSAIWVLGQPIGKRPLLILGILLIIVGIQLFSLGLIAELMIANGRGRKENG